MTVTGALSSFRERRKMSPHKRACGERTNRWQPSHVSTNAGRTADRMGNERGSGCTEVGLAQ